MGMKRFATGLLCFAVIPLVAGCSSQKSSEAPTTENTTTVAQIPEFVEQCKVVPVETPEPTAEKSAEDKTTDTESSTAAKSTVKDKTSTSADAKTTAEQDDSAILPEKLLTTDVTVTLKTNAGEIPMKLTTKKAPCTVSTVAHLVKQGFYDDSVCHRITADQIYVLQCGDPSGTGEGGPGFVFKDEYPVGTEKSGLYKAGVVAMANYGPNTNGSQFFLTYEDSPLPANYTIFGTITEAGMKTLKEISAKGAKQGVADGPPASEVRIQKATVAETAEPSTSNTASTTKAPN